MISSIAGRNRRNAPTDNGKRLLCPLCASPKPMKEHHFLYRHLEEAHVGVSHDCFQCNKRIRGRHHRNEHISTFHANEHRSHSLDIIKKRNRMEAIFKSQLSNSYFRIVSGTRGDLEEVGLDEQPIPGGIILTLPYTDPAASCTPSASSSQTLPPGQNSGDQPLTFSVGFPTATPLVHGLLSPPHMDPVQPNEPLFGAYQAQPHVQRHWGIQSTSSLWSNAGAQFNQPPAHTFGFPNNVPFAFDELSLSHRQPPRSLSPATFLPPISGVHNLSHITSYEYPLHTDYLSPWTSATTPMSTLSMPPHMPLPESSLLAQLYNSYDYEIHGSHPPTL